MFAPLALASRGLASVAVAQPPSAVSVEAGYGEAKLTANYPPWKNAYARATYSSGVGTTFYFDAVHRRAFGDASMHLSASVTHTLSPDWYGALSAGTSPGDFLFPRAHSGAMIARKWLSRRQLVSTTGLSFYQQSNSHRNLLWAGSTLYYFQRPVVVETGINVTRSAPGSVISRRLFVAGNLGRPDGRTLTGHFSAGREAYMRLGVDTALVAFRSHGLTLRWREVVAPNAGVTVEFEQYVNPLYRRRGLSLGAFIGTGILKSSPRVREQTP